MIAAPVLEDDVDREFESDLDKSLDLRSRVLSRIRDFEDDIASLHARASDSDDAVTDEDIEEILEEEKLARRLSFYDEIYHMFSEMGDPNHAPSKTYEESLYHLLLDRMRRSFGYYQALSRAQEEVRRRNNDIGDNAMSVDVQSAIKLLSKIDDIEFTRSLCSKLGVTDQDSDRLVNATIDREFSHG